MKSSRRCRFNPQPTPQYGQTLSTVRSISTWPTPFASSIRAGISAVHRGQWEAAEALALKRRVIWGRIILPQVFAKILPPLTNEFTMLVKASPLLSVITVVELTRTAQQVMLESFRPVEALTAAAIFYFIICFLLSSLTRRLEARVQVRGA